MINFRKILNKIKHFILYSVLHVDDTPHSIALGIALGIFVAWTPTLGFQMLLVLLLTAIFHANGRVALPFVWISNPFTFFIIYFPNFWLGHHLLSLFIDRSNANFDRALQSLHSPIQAVLSFFQGTTPQQLRNFLLENSLDLWIGSIIMGLFLGSVSYILSFKVIVWYRTHHPRGKRLVIEMSHQKTVNDSKK